MAQVSWVSTRSGGFLVQRGSLDVKRTFARVQQRAHLGLHLGATEYGGVNAAAADHRFVPGFRGVVTEVADPDQVVAEAQGKHDLRPARE